VEKKMIDLYHSMKNSQGDMRANKMLHHALSDIFHSNHRLTDAGLNPEELRKMLFDSRFLGEIIFEGRTGSDPEVWGETLSLVFLYARENGINLLSDSFFATWISQNGNRLNDDINSSRYSNYWQRPSPEYLAVIEAGFISGSANPATIFKDRYSRIKRTYLNSFDVELIKSIAIRDSEVMIQTVEDTEFVKRVSYTIRAKIYSSLAECGKLSKRAARKIRSDSSEEASDAGVRAIAANLKKFDNAPEILSQVMDTKHYSSARYLAENVQKEYLPFMAVCQDQRIRELVVARMQGVSNV
jgi:hypothetical protein